MEQILMVIKKKIVVDIKSKRDHIMKSFILISVAIVVTFTSITPSLAACPGQGKVSEKMIENFLTNPHLQDARKETGTVNLNTTQIQAVTDENVCLSLNNEFDPFRSKYKISYYKVGNFYFVTQLLKQPQDSHTIATGLSYIYIYDKNLNFIKGYSG